jgi:AraC family transcriptional regulator
VHRGAGFLGKIAPSGIFPAARVVAQGADWSVAEVVCSAGPLDRPCEERHPHFSVSIVTSGTFHYRSAAGAALMTPGSLLLGQAERHFECGHEHGTGDRCIAFHFSAGYFERLASDAGVAPEFRVPRLPPLRDTSLAIARARAGLAGAAVSWEELGIQLAAQAVQLAEGRKPDGTAPPGALGRVTAAVRGIERDPAAELSLAQLAHAARLSPYHFLRTFQRATGVTPHQFILRQRLSAAARRLARERTRILDVALDCGFGDLANFNHAFRAEFGVSPRRFRRS